jgi:outer membrane biosynthesis protein TonB
MNISLSNNDKKGLAISIAVHIVLIVIFLLVGLKYMVPPPPPEGITIDFGNSDEGMSKTTVEPQTNSSPQQQTSVQETAQEEVLTQETQDAPEITKPVETSPEPEPTPEPKPDEQLTNAFENWTNNQNSNSNNQNEGETGNPGNQGQENGDPNANNYTGGGSGNGVSFSLSGRSMVAPPKITNNTQEKGIVVVDIWVDNNGNVTKAIPGVRGSTTTSSILYKKAKDAALNTKFSAKPDAPAIQKGTMTFVFILN